MDEKNPPLQSLQANYLALIDELSRTYFTTYLAYRFTTLSYNILITPDYNSAESKQLRLLRKEKRQSVLNTSASSTSLLDQLAHLKGSRFLVGAILHP
jgi:hypothetical protein